MSQDRIISIEFDGVLHPHQPSGDAEARPPWIIEGPPAHGAIGWLRDVIGAPGYAAIVHSPRCRHPEGVAAMTGWLGRHGLTPQEVDELELVTHKPAGAHLALDGRAVAFSGVFPSLEEVAAFTPWTSRGRILWLDVETTGLEPGADHILEVAALVTDTHGVRVAPPFDTLVTLTPCARDRLAGGAYPEVVPMHTDSGLLYELEHAGALGRRIAPLELVLDGLEDYIEVYAVGARLGGCNPGFDAAMLEAARPGILDELDHRQVDVNTLDLLTCAAGTMDLRGTARVVSMGTRHRAGSDVSEAIAAWCMMMAQLGVRFEALGA